MGRPMKHLIAVFAIIAFSGIPAFACSCMFPDSAKAQVEGSDIVFEGQVIKVAPEKLRLSWWQRIRRAVLGPPEFEMRNDVTTFQVNREIKGKAGQNMAISHLPGEFGATCGISFRPGETYVILAFETTEPGVYSTSLCSSAAYPSEDYQPVD